MRRTTKIVNLAAALGALAAPAAAPEIANATDSDEAQIAKASEPRAEKKADIKLPPREDLMGFTVHENSDGTMVAQHDSHVSHSSHVSHTSHVSSSQ